VLMTARASFLRASPRAAAAGRGDGGKQRGRREGEAVVGHREPRGRERVAVGIRKGRERPLCTQVSPQSPPSESWPALIWKP